MRVLAAAAEPAATITRIRIAEPMSAWLATTGGDGQPLGELRLRPLHDTARADLAWAEVLVLQRGTAQRHLALMQDAAAMGRAVIYEIDDLLTEAAPHLLHAQALERDAPWVRACLDAADLVTVSTPRLADLLGLAAGRWALVPNTAQPSADAEAPVPAQRPGGLVSVLVAASDRVAGAAAWAALARVAHERPERLVVHAVGPVADDLVAAGVPCERHALMPRAAFVRWAAALPNPLAVIPLDDSRFSAGKSAIKWYDYAEAGVPTLASDAGPYRDNLVDGRTGWLVGPSTDAWLAALGAATGDAAARTRIAEAARDEVRARHHAGLMAAAWGRALALAQERATQRMGGRPLEAAPTGWADALRDRTDRLKLALRRWNRERLARRRG